MSTTPKRTLMHPHPSVFCLSCLVFILFSHPLLTAISERPAQVASDPLLNSVPFPQNIVFGEGNLHVPPLLPCKVTGAGLQPLIDVLNGEYRVLTGGRIVASHSEANSPTRLELTLDSALSKESYRLVINTTIQIIGGSYQALAMGSVTFLQLLTRKDEEFTVPRLTISDGPAASFRALLVDVARNWHSTRTLEQLIELARWYKINYLQLHLTDNELFTFPTHAFPELATPEKHYTKRELSGLVEYARVRGVTIIPELDVPGHARLMVERRPDKFGFVEKVKDERGRTISTINMGREASYGALDTLVGEIAKIFKTSPYIHMGGDEANLQPLTTDSEVQGYLSAHKLISVEDLYRHFIVRMNESVKRNRKQMIVWEGFRGDGQVEIPRDIIVMEFETAYQLPQELLAAGYTVINTSWKPLYVVNDRKWEPGYIYEVWNPYRWESPFPQRPSFVPIQLEPTPQVIGSMMCAWEQKEEIEVLTLRRRIAVMSERVWHGGLKPERSLAWFESAFVRTDAALEMMLGIHQQ